MSKRSYIGPLVLCAMAATLAIGLFQIFRIRMVSGEYYPPWSSLRSEPDGTRVLFDSLAATGHFETMRKYKKLADAPEHNATILFLGSAPSSLLTATNADLDELETAARSGNRLVVALDPNRWSALPEKKVPSLTEKRWGINIGRIPPKDNSDNDNIALFFTRADGWTKFAENSGRLVIIERAFGAGSIVLDTSSDVFANRSLAIERDSGLLVQLIGANSRVVFDESHLGVQDSGSVLGLVHKYRLDGALWGLLVLAAVFVWGNAAGFPPPEPPALAPTKGHDARGGLAQLLRRQIPASRVIHACITEWQRSNIHAKLRNPAIDSDPVEAYRALQQELTHK